ncbi:MAG: phage tail protein [Burkholderiales bacterium]
MDIQGPRRVALSGARTLTTLLLAYAAGTAAASFGWGALGVGASQMAGAMLGNALFGRNLPDLREYGPRQSDLRVTTSTYGNSIPLVFGAMRVPANVIWSTHKVETAHVSVQGSGGKGGGGGTVTTTSYSYSICFASSLCEGPISSVRKIWANGNLVYNIDSRASRSSVAASGALDFRLHRGGEDEVPDSLIEAHAGPSPAYRGTAHMVFENLQLESYGNELPNLEFEAVSVATENDLKVGDACDFGGFPDVPLGAASAGGGQLWLVGHATLYLFNTWSKSWRSLALPSGRQFYFGTLATGPDGSLWIMNKPYYSTPGFLRIVSPELTFREIPVSPAYFGANGTVLDANGIFWGFGDEYYASIYRLDPASGHALRIYQGAYLVRERVWAYSHPWILFEEGQQLKRLNVEFMTVDALFDTGWYGITGLAADGSGFWASLADSSRAMVLRRYSREGGMQDEIRLPEALQYPGENRLKMDGSGHLWFASQSPPRPVFKFDPASREWLAKSEGIGPYWNGTGEMIEDCGSLYLLDNYRAILRQADMIPTLSEGQTPLSEVFGKLCAMAGLAASDIDASGISDIPVEGYLVKSRASARSMLEPLMRAYYIDAVESGDRIKFVRRGGPVLLTIPEADLAAHLDTEDMPDQLHSVRAQESELPLEVSVTYFDKDADYQSGVQYSRRLVTSSRNKVTVDLPLALSASRAKHIADVLLYDAWASRITYQFATSRKYAFLEPTDVIRVQKGARLYTLRIVKTHEERGIIRFEAVAEDASVYLQDSAASNLPATNPEVRRASPTELQLLDIPLLSDRELGSGCYAAASGFTEDWPGAQLFQSIDDGASYQAIGSAFLRAATLGHALSVLGAFPGANGFDECNWVEIGMQSGRLFSVTRDAVLNGANAALLGCEILQFRVAELVAEKTYRLSGLLRARCGTEWATHAAGERFVLLDASLQWISVAEGLPRKYRAATLGTFLADARETGFVNTGESRKPLSPVGIGGGRDSAGNLHIRWIRRTRIDGAWRDYVDAGLGEAAESYEIDILDGGEVRRTLASPTPYAIYTREEQEADFGALRPSVTLRICQLSEGAGRGHPGTAEV